MTNNRGRKQKLDLESICQASLQLMDKNGAESLSMRSLAEHLSVGTMTLYGYFKNKSDLINGTIDYAIQDFDFCVDIKENETPRYYRDQLTALSLQLHRLSLTHAAIVEILVMSTHSNPTLNEFRNSLMGLLLNLGLSNRETVNASMVLTSFTVGFGMIRKSRVTADNKTKLPDIEPSEYPYLTALEKERRVPMGEEGFLYGLNKLLDSILPKRMRH